MFKKILVPLDGSAFSEQALAAAFSLAGRFSSDLVLLRVVAPDEAPVIEPGMGVLYAGQRLRTAEQEETEAEAYLQAIRADWLGSGLTVNTAVACGAPAEKILELAADVDANLIVMSTHGRTGFSRLIYGSVAEAVLRAAHIPVMLVPIKA